MLDGMHKDNLLLVSMALITSIVYSARFLMSVWCRCREYMLTEARAHALFLAWIYAAKCGRGVRNSLVSSYR